MGLVLLQRALALGAAAILAAVAGVAIVEQRKPEPKKPVLPTAVPAMGGGWYEGSAAPKLDGAHRHEDRLRLRPQEPHRRHRSSGARVRDEALPRVRLARGADAGDLERVPTGVQFAVTPRVAKLLGLQSTDIVRWRYAAANQ